MFISVLPKRNGLYRLGRTDPIDTKVTKKIFTLV